MIDTSFVLSAVCKEPEGTVVRSVYKMPLTRENLLTFWEKAKKFRTVFNTEHRNSFEKFCSLFLSGEDENNLKAHGLFWVIDDFVGIYYMTDITDWDASVHYTFFDRRHSGREELTREMLRHVFERFGFQRLSVEIPMYSSEHTFKFVENLGFKFEGRKRQCVKYKDGFVDLKFFGLLREDALNERAS